MSYGPMHKVWISASPRPPLFFFSGPLTSLDCSLFSADFIQWLAYECEKLSHCFSSCCDIPGWGWDGGVCPLVRNAPLINHFQSCQGSLLAPVEKYSSNQAP